MWTIEPPFPFVFLQHGCFFSLFLFIALFIVMHWIAARRTFLLAGPFHQDGGLNYTLCILIFSSLCTRRLPSPLQDEAQKQRWAEGNPFRHCWEVFLPCDKAFIGGHTVSSGSSYTTILLQMQCEGKFKVSKWYAICVNYSFRLIAKSDHLLVCDPWLWIGALKVGKKQKKTGKESFFIVLM